MKTTTRPEPPLLPRLPLLVHPVSPRLLPPRRLRNHRALKEREKDEVDGGEDGAGDDEAAGAAVGSQ